MSSLAKAVNFDANTMWVDITDGRKLGVPLAYSGELVEPPATCSKATSPVVDRQLVTFSCFAKKK